MTKQSGLSIVERLWLSEKCLCINGIHWADGWISGLSLQRSADGVCAKQTGRVLASNVLEASPNRHTALAIEAGRPGPSDTTIHGGEGAEGAEGFVALCDENDRLLWLAYFEDSNPFLGETTRLLDDETFAIKSTHGAEWRFSIKAPQDACAGKGEFGWPWWDD